MYRPELSSPGYFCNETRRACRILTWLSWESSWPQGDGTALELQCALCFEVWRHEKGRCHACGETGLGHYAAPELAHLEVQACESCGIYLNLVHQEKDPEAVPDVDEIAALPLDVWAKEKGFRKPIPNLIGM